jgi:hypothetical protein
MMDHEKRGTRFSWRRIVFGAGVGFLVLLVMVALIAWLIGMELVGDSWMDELAALTLVLSGLLSGIIGKGEMDQILDALAAGGILLLGLLVVSVLSFDFDLLGWLSAGAAVLGGSGVSLLLRRSGHRRKPWKKYGYG